MKRVGFIGACDKANLIMYVAKALTWQNQRVLVVDSTRLQKMKYLVPNINPTAPYITDFEGIDFAVGFGSSQVLEQYLGNEMSRMPYDYILVDVDTSKGIVNYGISEFDKNYFVTAFDTYSLKRGLEIISVVPEPLKMKKIFFRYQMIGTEEEYINYLSMDSKVEWEEGSIYLPNDGSDIQQIEENQKISRIRIKKLGKEFQNGIILIIQDLIGEQNKNVVKRRIRA